MNKLITTMLITLCLLSIVSATDTSTTESLRLPEADIDVAYPISFQGDVSTSSSGSRDNTFRNYLKARNQCILNSFEELTPYYLSNRTIDAVKVWTQPQYAICADWNAYVWQEFLPFNNGKEVIQ